MCHIIVIVSLELIVFFNVCDMGFFSDGFIHGRWYKVKKKKKKKKKMWKKQRPGNTTIVVSEPVCVWLVLRIEAQGSCI